MPIPRHSKVYGRVKPKFGTERNYVKKITFTKNPAPANRIESVFFLQNALERNSESLLLCLCRRFEFRFVFSSVEWFRMEFQVFASIFARNGISSCFLVRRMLQNGITGVCFYCYSIIQNSEHFYPLRNGSVHHKMNMEQRHLQSVFES